MRQFFKIFYLIIILQTIGFWTHLVSVPKRELRPLKGSVLIRLFMLFFLFAYYLFYIQILCCMESNKTLGQSSV